jgi:hypothetical protein
VFENRVLMRIFRPKSYEVEGNCEYILNKQSQTADKGWSSGLGVGRGANNSSP